ncbi:hypothetical protein COCC4DRAFT_174088 [Bipolaris maydis ATCC 48331]|uniref:Ketoreductase domain-containing protein n=2 Tax=Cochliobolus heterostrophus TaxID=5016 RepID=M2UVZ0_COCH5|nr:uncharacterized protein COCC4DRAFT_174088 [Bipolaris maydis ATCC 48331]EMD97726.1 hypothetical protein COCHEDRAFT_1125528 [Bipolaris maydis C5]KAJ5031811.1 hypothetical protein J3E73DRAFT_377770 [Bipolaris maydis]ENI02878.1 hypothetical protein COCC4DRAFT_174088 [Bipolaris maydis ATCC 48331]KAJ5060135.1 hypothetical protein J3E74DRAFT_270768 [Bipolaris maydis]KAJ6202069.1 hypothetical protein J3E72DRAFT_436591 [Bipolaris maydis]
MALFDPSLSTLAPPNSTPKTILITGGSSGIGLATATLLSALNPNHNLILLDLHPPPPTFTHPPSHLLVHTCDVTSWPAQRAAFAAAYAKFSRIDAVFVNAGIAEHGDQFFTSALDSSGNLAEPDHRVLTLDLNAAAATTKLAIHYLRKNGGDSGDLAGSIVLTASLAGYLGSAGAPLYSAAKHGLVGLLRALKHECAKLRIAISLVAPGITVTPILAQGLPALRDLPPEEHAREMAKWGVPINSPDAVARAVCGLLSEGMAANGKGVWVQADRFADVEAGLIKSREAWMGRQMLELFKGGRRTAMFTTLEENDKVKAKM